ASAVDVNRYFLSRSFFMSFLASRAFFLACRISRLVWRLVFSAPLSVLSVSLAVSFASAAASFMSFFVSLCAKAGADNPRASAAIRAFIMVVPPERPAGGPASSASCAPFVGRTTLAHARSAGLRPGHRLSLGDDLSVGAVSTGFCVSVGWPVTSPGFDIPGSLVAGVSPVGEGDAGRATLPLGLSGLAGGVRLPLCVSLVSVPVAEPAPWSDPLVVPLVRLSVRARRISLLPVRPCAFLCLGCFFALTSALREVSV